MTQDTQYREFHAAVDAGDATAALMVAPFGYRSSSYAAEGFEFRITSGKYANHRGTGSRLIDAIRNALPEPR